MQLREAPSDILRLQQLRILDLSQNSLQSIPEVTYIFVMLQKNLSIQSLLIKINNLFLNLIDIRETSRGFM